MIQGLKIDQASFHFIFDNQGPYISYKNCPEDWRLVNGEKPIVIKQKYFENYSYTAAEKLFRAEINWEKGYSFQKAIKNIYELKFDDNFTNIISGKIEFILENNEENFTGYMNDELFYRRY